MYSCVPLVSFLLLLLLLAHSAPAFLFCDPVCGNPLIQPRSIRIVGGHESVEGALPWMVMLTEYGYFICGGAIVNERFILTAAHCFHGKDINDTTRWRVVAGKHNLNYVNIGEQVLTVDAILVHAHFNDSSGANDIALVKVTQSIVFTDKIRPVCLPSSHEILTVGQTCIAAGWGVTLDTAEAFSSLNQVTLPVISDEVCAQPDWQQEYFLPELTFCAGYEEGGKDTCAGDSGSPLVCEFLGTWFASGIVSLGKTCALPRKPGVYTNVSHFAQWIRTQMVQNGYILSCGP